MPDILADAKAWIAANDGDTTEDRFEVETLLRGLVTEVACLDALLHEAILNGVERHMPDGWTISAKMTLEKHRWLS